MNSHGNGKANEEWRQDNIAISGENISILFNMFKYTNEINFCVSPQFFLRKVLENYYLSIHYM